MTKLNDKLFELNTLDNLNRRLLKEHFLKYSKECGECKECEYKHHILEVYELLIINPEHKHNLRKSLTYLQAEQFVKYHYVADGK